MISKSLGRGLGSLIPPKSDSRFSVSSAVQPSIRPTNVSQQHIVVDLPISNIASNPYQPRKEFSERGLNDLKASIADVGILQPLLVTKNEHDQYELVSGERRLLAARALGMKTVPAIIRSAKDVEKLELAIIENVQREDLNPIEEAEGIQRLADEFSLTHEEISQKVGKSRSHISNIVRLLKLPPVIQDALRKGEITASHAKIICGIPDEREQMRLFRTIIDHRLSVHSADNRQKNVHAPSRHPFLATQEDDLRSTLGTKVTIRPKGKGGSIVIEYYSGQELVNIVQKILRQ